MAMKPSPVLSPAWDISKCGIETQCFHGILICRVKRPYMAVVLYLYTIVGESKKSYIQRRGFFSDHNWVITSQAELPERTLCQKKR